MKKIYFLLSILSCIAMSSCIYDKVFEEEGNNNNDNNDPIVCRLSASLLETTFGQDINAKAIGFFLKDSSSLLAQTNNPIVLSSGYKEIAMAEGSDSIGYCYAYYPHVSSSSISNSIYTGAVSASQDQPVSTSQSLSEIPLSITDQLLMISNNSGRINFKNEIARIQFKNVFSLMRFEIKANRELIEHPNFINQRIKKFEMYFSTSTDTLTPVINLVGQYTIDLSISPGESGYSGLNFTNRTSRIAANITESPVINASTPIIVWIVIPPLSNVFSGHKLVVKLETEDSNNVSFNTFSTVSGFGKIERNTLIPVSIELTKNSIYSDDVVKESFVDKPANSYVISELGLYEIAAKKISGEIPNGASVDWLWASKEGGGGAFTIGELISNISFDSSSKTIRFRVGSGFGITEGNVVLALKDASGNIVWTWHIWITDKPGDVQYDGNKFLDRNIGALSADTLSPAIDTYGFVYQWGRKDPFVGGDGVIYDESDMPLYVARTHTIVNTSATWGAGVSEWSQVGMAANTSVEESRKYPMRFFYNGESSSEADPADWLHESETDLWSDEGKTDYDPCPYGYKVPDKGDLNALHMAFDNYEIYLEDLKVNPSKPIPSIWFYNRKNSNRYWEYSYSNTVTSWPLTGMRQGRNTSGKWIGAQLKYAGTDNRMGRAFYWTSTPLSIDGKVVPGSSHRIATNGSILNGSILYSPDEYGANADAYPVRCVKMTNP